MKIFTSGYSNTDRGRESHGLCICDPVSIWKPASPVLKQKPVLSDF